MHFEQGLPSYPIFEDTRNLLILSKDNLSSSIKLNTSVLTMDSSLVYNLELAFGTSCALLLLFIVALSIVIYVQRKEINGLRAFFRGHNSVEEMQPMISNENRNQTQIGEGLFHADNQHRVHQNRNINNVADLIFPQVVPGFRVVTAIRNFHKNQSDALKIYHVDQMRIFQSKLKNIYKPFISS